LAPGEALRYQGVLVGAVLALFGQRSGWGWWALQP